MPAHIGELRSLPGPIAQAVIRDAREYCVTAVQNDKLVLHHGRAHGVTVYDVDGNIYLDFFAGAGVNNLGYGVETVAGRARLQINSGISVYDFSVFLNTSAVRLCAELAKAAPGYVQRKVFLANSGTEAVEAALKVAQAARPGRRHWISFEGAFHGRTLGSLSFNASKPEHRLGFSTAFEPLCFPFPSYEGALDSLFERVQRSIMPSDIIAVILEPVQGEGGVNIANHHELARLNDFCRRYQIVRIVDEVQTGMGRTGKLFALEHFPEFQADIITVAKALGGGLPVSAAIIDADLDFSYKGRHANTMGGSMIGAETALAFLETLKNNAGLFAHVQKMGEYLRRRLLELEQTHNQNCSAALSTSPLYTAPRLSGVRGLGLMVAVDFSYPKWRDPQPSLDPRIALEDACLERGLIVCSTGRRGIRFLPPLIVERSHIDKAIEIFESALQVFGTVKN